MPGGRTLDAEGDSHGREKEVSGTLQAGRQQALLLHLTGKDGKRHKVSTGEVSKEKARGYIRDFVDKQRSKSSTLAFADYASSYYLPESCPHFIRYRQEGKSIGLNHLSHCRSLLEKHIFTDSAFSSLPIAELRRGDILDLRSRLLKSGMGTNTVNKCVSAIKTILSEACFRDDIDTNPGAQVGNIKYEKKERGVLAPEEVGGLLALLSARTERLQRLAVGAASIKRGAKISRKEMNATLALRDEATIAFLFCTGVRAGELRALRWSSVDLKRDAAGSSKPTMGRWSWKAKMGQDEGHLHRPPRLGSYEGLEG